MSKETKSSIPPAKPDLAAFTVPRPADVPGSTPPPNRSSFPAPDGTYRGRAASVPPAGAPQKPRVGTGPAIPGAPGVPRVSSPPRPGTTAPRLSGDTQPAVPQPAVPQPAVPQPAAPARAAEDDRPTPVSSGVVVTPMRIINVSAPARPPVTNAPPRSEMPGSDWPTPLEVPAARGKFKSQPDSDEMEEDAVPLMRVSSPPPEPILPEAPAMVAPVRSPTDPSPAEAVTPPDGARSAAERQSGYQERSASLPPPSPSNPPPLVVDEAPPSPPANALLAEAPPPPPSALPSRTDAIPPTHPSASPRPKPPLPVPDGPEVEVEVEVAPDSDPMLESLDEEDLTEVDHEPPKKRLPPPPPLRTSFSDVSADDSKRKAWWEEFFQEDYDLSTPPLTAPQLDAEVNFIEAMLGIPSGGTILDLGCGNGQYAVALSQRGYSVVGLDWSTAMLTRGSSLARGHNQPVEFKHGDMRELGFDQRFDAVLCWNATFGFFERERNQAVLHGVLRSLKPGGSFLLDLPNRDFIIAQEPAQNWFEGPGCICMDDMRLDYITSRLHVKRTIMLDDGRNRECNYSIRVFSLHELGRLLHETGFRVTQLSGSVITPGVFLGSASPRLIVLVHRPPE